LVFFRGLCWNGLLAQVLSHSQLDEQQENSIPQWQSLPHATDEPDEGLQEQKMP